MDLRGLIPFFSPPFDWIQVEVTSHCNAACVYCPRTAYATAWQNRHLPMETFIKLAPAFRKSRLVHLQGWGEPFMNPHFFQMLEIAKGAGCQVGTTTNGMLLNGERIARLLDHEIDLVAFSLAGTGEENDRIRKGTRLERVLQVIRALSEEKSRRNVQKPAIHIAYMLLRSGLEGLERLSSLVEGLGVSHIVISTLDFAPSDELVGEVLRPETKAEYERWESLIEKVSQRSQEQGIRFYYHLPFPEQRRTECTENVGRALCVSSDGAVTPCVYTNLELADSFYFTEREGRPYSRMSFGNVNERPLEAIWSEAQYKAFRSSFRKGFLAVHCEGCPKLC